MKDALRAKARLVKRTVLLKPPQQRTHENTENKLPEIQINNTRVLRVQLLTGTWVFEKRKRNLTKPTKKVSLFVRKWKDHTVVTPVAVTLSD